MNEEDLLMAMAVARETRRLAWGVRESYWGRIDPKDVLWNRATDLVSASESAAWCIGWLVAEVRRMEEAVQAERSRADAPHARILRQIRSLEGRRSYEG